MDNKQKTLRSMQTSTSNEIKYIEKKQSLDEYMTRNILFLF